MTIYDWMAAFLWALVAATWLINALWVLFKLACFMCLAWLLLRGARATRRRMRQAPTGPIASQLEADLKTCQAIAQAGTANQRNTRKEQL